MRDLIWDIAKSNEQDLSNTDLQDLEDPKDLFVARGLSIEAKDNTTKINKFVDHKIARDVYVNGAIKVGETVFNYSKSYKTRTVDLYKLVDWATNKKLGNKEISNLVAIMGTNFVPKLRGLDFVADRKGMFRKTARDTFTEKEWEDEPRLQAINTTMASAPLWAIKLKDFERRSD